MKIIFSLTLLLVVYYPQATLALDPPRGDETLCAVEGEVLSHQSQEASDMRMNRLEVNTITLEIHKISPMNEDYKGTFCDRLAVVNGETRQKINTFRLCDGTDAEDGQIIQGIAGKSLGGGPYCIENIEALDE